MHSIYIFFKLKTHKTNIFVCATHITLLMAFTMMPHIHMSMQIFH